MEVIEPSSLNLAVDTDPKEETAAEVAIPPPHDQSVDQHSLSEPTNTDQGEGGLETEAIPEEKSRTTGVGQFKKFYDAIQKRVVMWKLIAFILSCAWRCFFTPASHNPLGAYSTTLAHYFTVCHWIMMGAFLWSSLKHTCCTQPADTVQKENKAEAAEALPEGGVAPGMEEMLLDVNSQETAGASSEEVETDMEIQPRNMKDPMADVQEEMAWIRELLVQGITYKEPQARSPLEQLLAHRWTAPQ